MISFATTCSWPGGAEALCLRHRPVTLKGKQVPPGRPTRKHTRLSRRRPAGTGDTCAGGTGPAAQTGTPTRLSPSLHTCLQPVPAPGFHAWPPCSLDVSRRSQPWGVSAEMLIHRGHPHTRRSKAPPDPPLGHCPAGFPQHVHSGSLSRPIPWPALSPLHQAGRVGAQVGALGLSSPTPGPPVAPGSAGSLPAAPLGHARAHAGLASGCETPGTQAQAACGASVSPA